MLSLTRAKLTGEIFHGGGGRGGGSNLLVMGSCEGHWFFFKGLVINLLVDLF